VILLEQITMKEFEDYLSRTKIIVFPYGTVEEHGSHLPLNTDSLIIREALLLAAKRMMFFIAPLIPYGVCSMTKDHPGTISITPETLRRLTEDLVTDAYAKGLRRVLLATGHGGTLHYAALREAAEKLVEQFSDIKIALFSPFDLLAREISEISETPNDSHAGEIETSIVLHLAPKLVKGRAEEGYPRHPRPFIVKDKLKYWPGGVWGNPGKASVEKGEKAISLIADKVVEIIGEMEEGI
jgi:creatinine amidohydrolase